MQVVASNFIFILHFSSAFGVGGSFDLLIIAITTSAIATLARSNEVFAFTDKLIAKVFTRHN